MNSHGVQAHGRVRRQLHEELKLGVGSLKVFGGSQPREGGGQRRDDLRASRQTFAFQA